jgi:KDO2-lipid IV(A) lauroyltransferase
MRWLLKPLMALLMLFARIEVKVLPVSWLFAMGRWSVAVMFRVLPGMRRALLANAAHLLGPQSSLAERKALGAAVMHSFSRFFVEVLTAPKTYPSAEAFLARMQGKEHGEEARALGKGVIAITVHMGNFELGPMLFAQQYQPVAIVYHRDPFGLVESMRSEKRREHAVREIATDASPLFGVEVLDVLRQGGFVLVAGDRGFSHQRGKAYPFFDGQAKFLTWPARTALASGAPLLPCFVVRADDGEYTVHLEPPIVPGRDGDDVDALMQKLVPVFERYVRAHPEQWLILHPYWEESAPAEATAQAPSAVEG